MGVPWLVVVLCVLFLAYSNGANDNFKGVATLFGSGTCSYRQALAWATLSTGAGSLLALVLAQGLVETFKGKGLVPDALIPHPAFVTAVSAGAALTVLLATWTGLPVSTTHALTGALLGAGLLAAPGEVRFAALGASFVLPLLVSPAVSLALTAIIYRFVHRIPGPDAEPGRVLNGLHYLSSGAVGFARGLNDTPKIVALLLAGESLDPALALVLVAAVMAVGGILNARRVAETMSRKITPMTPAQGFVANLVTALLVGLASRNGMPVSTTHVAVGSLFGIGLVNGTASAHTVRGILLAWVTTLPVGAVLAAGIYALQATLAA